MIWLKENWDVILIIAMIVVPLASFWWSSNERQNIKNWQWNKILKNILKIAILIFVVNIVYGADYASFDGLGRLAVVAIVFLILFWKKDTEEKQIQKVLDKFGIKKVAEVLLEKNKAKDEAEELIKALGIIKIDHAEREFYFHKSEIPKISANDDSIKK